MYNGEEGFYDVKSKVDEFSQENKDKIKSFIDFVEDKLVNDPEYLSRHREEIESLVDKIITKRSNDIDMDLDFDVLNSYNNK